MFTLAALLCSVCLCIFYLCFVNSYIFSCFAFCSLSSEFLSPFVLSGIFFCVDLWNIEICTVGVFVWICLMKDRSRLLRVHVQYPVTTWPNRDGQGRKWHQRFVPHKEYLAILERKEEVVFEIITKITDSEENAARRRRQGDNHCHPTWEIITIPWRRHFALFLLRRLNILWLVSQPRNVHC